MSNGTQDKYITAGEAAKILNVSRSTVYNLMDRGELPSVRFGQCRRISLRVIRDYEKRSTVQAAERVRTDDRAVTFAVWLNGLAVEDVDRQRAAEDELESFGISVRRKDGGLLRSGSRVFRRQRESAPRLFSAWLDGLDSGDRLARDRAESSLGRLGISVRKLAPKPRPSK